MSIKNEEWAPLTPSGVAKCKKLAEAIDNDDEAAVESMISQGVFYMPQNRMIRDSEIVRICTHGLAEAAWKGKKGAVAAFMKTREIWGGLCQNEEGEAVSERQMIASALGRNFRLQKSIEIAEMLRDGGQEESGRWAMAASCGAGTNLAILEWMLGAGLNPREKGYSGKTALMWAAESGSPDVIKKLLAMSDARAVDDAGKTALMWACENWPNFELSAYPQFAKIWHDHSAESLKIMEMLIPESDARAASHEGETALMLAAAEGAVPLVKKLLPHVDVNARDKKERLALTIAIEARREDIVAILFPIIAENGIWAS